MFSGNMSPHPDTCLPTINRATTLLLLIATYLFWLLYFSITFDNNKCNNIFLCEKTAKSVMHPNFNRCNRTIAQPHSTVFSEQFLISSPRIV